MGRGYGETLSIQWIIVICLVHLPFFLSIDYNYISISLSLISFDSSSSSSMLFRATEEKNGRVLWDGDEDDDSPLPRDEEEEES